MSLIAFKADMQYGFFFSNFVWSTYASPWLQLAAQGKLGVLPQQACSAFSQVTFGRHHASRDLVIGGVERYGLAVSKVRGGLADPSSPRLGELLVPVLIFLMYSSADADQAASGSHAMGLFTILKFVGPRAFQQPELRAAFSSCRAALIIISLLQRRKLFLEELAWRIDPWSADPTSKNPQDQLADILVHVPGFLQEHAEGAVQPAFLRRVLQQLDILLAWRWQWGQANPRAATETAPPDDPINAMRRPAEATNSLHYCSFVCAVEISLYNAVLLCLLGLLYSELSMQDARAEINKFAAKNDQAKQLGPESALALPIPGLLSMRTAAVEIARSFEFQLKHVQESNGAPALFWLFPLGLASKVLRADADMTMWIQQMVDMSEVTRGYGRGDNAFGFGFYDLPNVDESGW
jgi:hypothetical protein